MRITLAAALFVACLLALVGCVPATKARTSTEPTTDATRPAVQTVSLPYRGYGMARVVGNMLYVSVDSGTGLIDTLLRHDLRTGTSTKLFTVPADIAWVAVNDRWLLWESEKRLYAQPTQGGARRTLATSREAYGPALEGDMAAWVDHEEGSEPRIVSFNLATGQKREIARTHVAEFYNNFMQIRDGKLLWTDIYDGTGHYVLHDLATAETTAYPMPATRFRYPGYAVRSGDAVFSINFDRYDQWDWSAQEAGRYSLTDGTFVPITKSGQYINALVVGEQGVAVIDSQQRLLTGPADGSHPATNLSDQLGTQIDAVQVSADGLTAVAGCSSPQDSKTRLFVFQLR